MGFLQAFPKFSALTGLPSSDRDIRNSLMSLHVKRVQNFALGPEGTNIAQACRQWLRRMSIEHKADITLCDTPEDSVVAAQKLNEPKTLAVFWTCAVYTREMELFFGNPDTLPFFAQEIMALDQMQLATRAELAATTRPQDLPVTWRIASHPSPLALLHRHHANFVLVNSNSAAAAECAAGRVETCITTESARLRHNLERLHLFGSPEMVFFAGITLAGAELMCRAHAELRSLAVNGADAAGRHIGSLVR